MSLCVTFQRTQSPQGALIWLRKKRDSVTMAAFQRGMHIRSPRISHKRLREHGRACISFTPFLSYLSCLLHPSSSHHPSLLPGFSTGMAARLCRFPRRPNDPKRYVTIRPVKGSRKRYIEKINPAAQSNFQVPGRSFFMTRGASRHVVVNNTRKRNQTSVQRMDGPATTVWMKRARNVVNNITGYTRLRSRLTNGFDVLTEPSEYFNNVVPNGVPASMKTWITRYV